MNARTAIAILMVCGAAACGPQARSNTGEAGTGSDGGNPSGEGGPIGAGSNCSSDLHSVLDSSGNVVETCPDNEGCSNGACIAACDAAAASKGTVGCDFVVATPSFYPYSTPPCFAVFLANNWPATSAITVARAGVTYDATTIGRVPDGTPNTAGWPAVAAGGLADSNVAVLFLSSDPGSVNGPHPLTCPVAPAVGTTNGAAVYPGHSVDETGVGDAFHITTSVPVSAYDILPYGGASSYLPSAELILPTTAWGTNYVAATPLPTNGPGWGQVVAAQDGTQIQITPTVALPAGTGVVAAPANTMTSYTLDAGQYIQWQAANDMAGSVISSTKPVSFTGGTGYLCLSSATSKGGGCDSAHQVIPPVSALGYQYVASPYATRRMDLMPESIKYRLVGTVAGTELTFAPAIPGAPATLTVGQVVELETIGPFTISSQDASHPFYVAQYMSGCNVTSGSRPGATGQGCLGDEEFVNVLPPAQWLSSYVFFTDPTYTTTNLVITRAKTTAGVFADVTVDCIGAVTGWTPVADGSQYETTNVDLQRITNIGTCVNGRHTATSTGPFNVMVWGLADAASYAYPAGGNVGAINSVVILQ